MNSTAADAHATPPTYLGVISKPVAGPGLHDEISTYVPLDHARSVFLRDKPAVRDGDGNFGAGALNRFYDTHPEVNGLVDALAGALLASGVAQLPSIPVHHSTRLYKETPPGSIGIGIGYPNGRTTMHVLPLAALPPAGAAFASALGDFRAALERRKPDTQFDQRPRR